ncbi:MAG: DUF2807 domain-containing protein [Defluviitaleaceae bacterium]|nr:DUF2807 domain-containing protein [Defluviitaleaceae bacterium]
MKRILLTAFILTAALLVFAGCNINATNSIRGTGSMTTQNINATDFAGIDIGGSYVLNFRQADHFAVTLEIQENLFRYVDATVRNGVLRISSDRNFNTTSANRPRLYVYAPYLDNLRVSGAVDADMTLDVERLEIDIAGAANVNLTGSADRLNIISSGASDLNAFDFIARDVFVNISGAGNADVYATDALEARISGAGIIRYDGNPQVTRNVSGVGSVRSRN